MGEAKINYHLKMKDIIKSLDHVPRLLLHSCCGPCSTQVISYLTEYFDITVLYYNPNIEPYDEYIKRKNEQIKFIKKFNPKNKLDFMDCDYANEDFQTIAKGYEQYPEGSVRCHRCYKLRLSKTAKLAKDNNYDYFCTTLTVSPYKNSQVINHLAEEISKEYKIDYLYSDFKKENGYLKSVEYAKKYNLYRQDYCGCHFAKDLQTQKNTFN